MSYAFPPGVGYRARAVRVVDGDTLDLTVDLGFHVTYQGRFRLLGIDTPELHSKDAEERTRAEEATYFVEAWLNAVGAFTPVDWALRIETKKDPDSFGRYLVKVFRLPTPVGPEEELGVALLAAGLAVPYP